MTISQDLALNVLLRQQASETHQAVVEKAERRLYAVKAPTAVPVRVQQVSVPGAAFKLAAGSYTAKDFMIAWRRAKDRNEQIQAIAGYTGYDNNAVFSINEYTAMSTAKKALAPKTLSVVKDKPETKGYVAGLPDNHFKRISDLLGREKLAAAALIEAELHAANLPEGSVQQLTALGMAEIERERLVAIQNDLSLLVK